MTTLPKVEIDLECVNGNVFAVLAAFASAARKQGWPKDAIEAVRKRVWAATSYDEALQAIMEHVQ